MEENQSAMIEQALPEQDQEVKPETPGSVFFKVVDGELFEVVGDELNIIANFYLLITSRSMLMDEEITIDQLLDLEIKFRNKIGKIR